MFRIVTIVEGEGEISALPVLLRRVISFIEPNFFKYKIEKPMRFHREDILNPTELRRMVELASLKVESEGAILILIDADDDCPFSLGPRILSDASNIRPDKTIKVVLAKSEYESWFISAAHSLSGQRGLPQILEIPENPEGIRGAKEWIKQQGISYSPTIDQAAFSALFDISEAERNSQSFSKFVRDIRSILQTVPRDDLS